MSTADQQLSQLHLLISAVRDYALLTLDPDGVVTSWNLGAERIKGYTADEIVGRHVSLFYPPEDVAAGKVERLLAAAAVDGSCEDEGWRVRKDGSRFWASVVITAMRDDGGHLVGFGKVTRDMTERKRFEDDLVEARLEAEMANEAKDAFLSNMSHELRTPLNAILGFSQLLEHDDLDDDQRDSIRHIRRAGDHLLSLINEVLDISRVSSGRVSLSLEPVSVAELVTEVLELLAPLAAQAGVTMRAGGPEHVFVRADHQRLRQVLINLLSNAVKYNVVDGRVEVAWAQLDGRARIAVKDSGIGMTDDQLRRLFTPFGRLEDDPSGVEGTGLGLVLSKGLVETMGGTLEVRSARGLGSDFTVDLLTADRPDVAEPDPHEQARAERSGRPAMGVLRLAYLEDNLSNLRLVERILRRRPDVELLSATQGRTGLDLVREHLPDVVLLDLHLPTWTARTSSPSCRPIP